MISPKYNNKKLRCISVGTCASNADCSITGEHCDNVSKKCKCGTADSCLGIMNNPTCDAKTGQCVPQTTCTTNEECKDGQICQQNKCVPGMLFVNIYILNDLLVFFFHHLSHNFTSSILFSRVFVIR